MKLIFLDIDGVLNWLGTEDRVGGFIGLDPTRIAQFNRIIDAHPDAKIVVSSTWRKGMAGIYEGLEGLKKLLADRGLKGEIIGATPVRYRQSRGDGIRAYLEEACASNFIEGILVLDDDTDGMSNVGDGFLHSLDLRPHHVRTFWDGEMHLIGGDTEVAVEGGLQDYHVEQAIAVLNGKLQPVTYD